MCLTMTMVQRSESDGKQLVKLGRRRAAINPNIDNDEFFCSCTCLGLVIRVRVGSTGVLWCKYGYC